MTAATVQAYGWEVHFTGGTSDKFYRMIYLQTGENRWTALANYGRRDACGQFKAYSAQSENAALRMAQDKTNEKEDKHYGFTRKLTPFSVERDLAFALIHGASTDPHVGQRLSSDFAIACAAAGNEVGNPSRVMRAS